MTTTMMARARRRSRPGWRSRSVKRGSTPSRSGVVVSLTEFRMRDASRSLTTFEPEAARNSTALSRQDFMKGLERHQPSSAAYDKCDNGRYRRYCLNRGQGRKPSFDFVGVLFVECIRDFAQRMTDDHAKSFLVKVPDALLEILAAHVKSLRQIALRAK